MKIINYIKSLSVFTAERPRFLEADVLFRYNFAKEYCKDKKVLDIGAGLGIGAQFLANNGADYVLGIDYSFEAIKQAKKLQGKNLEFRKLDALNLAKLDKKFDVALAFEIIEHLPLDQIDKFITQIYQVLKPKGILLLTTPNGLKTKYFLGKPYNPYHIKEYTNGELDRLLRKYFSGVRIQGYRCVSSSYRKIQNTLESSLIYKISCVLGHFKMVRELLAFLPRDIRRKVTGEKQLPDLLMKDFILDSDLKTSKGLIVVAQKSRGEIYKKFTHGIT